MATLLDESFNQPIFGANNLTGASPPLDGSGLTDTIKWKLAFNNGGVGTFLPLFFRLLNEMRQRMSQPQGVVANAPTHSDADVQQILQAAYVDPNDPSKLYVSQPMK
jgi:WW domain-binding protein 2